jgi:glycosyltransferase involved in cell wall biosynthesis
MSRRLLIVTSYFPPDHKAGGAEMFTMKMAKGLAEDHGWKVSIATTALNGEPQNEVIPNYLKVYRLPYRFKLSNSPLSASWVWKLRQVIEDAKPDVVNIHIPVPGLGDIASYVSGDRPIVINYHFGSMRKGSLVLDPIIWAYETILLPISLRKAARIVCGTEYVKNGILKKFNNKTSIIHPGVDSGRFYPAKNRAEIPRILYVGSLNRSDKHKRFSDLLEACKILQEDIPNLRLSAVGGGDGREMYENLVAEMGIAGSVDFHGRLEGHALPEAYRSAAVFVLPSLSETFGMVITEAMATGLPVVAVNGGGVPTLVEDGKNGILVPPRDPAAIARALKEILTEPKKASAFGSAGRLKVLERLVWPRQISLMHAVLMDAIT